MLKVTSIVQKFLLVNMIAPHQDNKILHRVQSSGYWLLHTWLLSLWWSSERNFPGWHWRLNWHAYVIYNPCFTCHMCASELTIQSRALTKFFFLPQGSDAWPKSGLTWWFSGHEHFTLLTPSSTSKAQCPCFMSASAASSPLAVAPLTAGKTWDLFPDRKAELVTAELSISFYSNFRRNVWISASCKLIIPVCLISLPVFYLSPGHCTSKFFLGGPQYNKL